MPTATCTLGGSPHVRALSMPQTPEQLTRQEIDRQLAECGWLVQDHASMNITAGGYVTVSESA